MRMRLQCPKDERLYCEASLSYGVSLYGCFMVAADGDVMSEKQSDALEVCDMVEASMPQNDSALGAKSTYERGVVLSFPKVLEVSFLYVDLNAADLSAEPLGPFSCKTILAL